MNFEILSKTLLASVILLLLSAAALGIGYLITGKSKLRKGCGTTPSSKKNSCSPGGCSQCSSKKD